MLARNLLAVFAVVVAIPAAAQQAAPAAAPAAAVHNCKKPGEHPGRLASDNMRRSWTKEANGYLDCLKKFALDQQAIAKPLFDQAKPHQDAANAAIEEHNKAATELRKIVEEMS